MDRQLPSTEHLSLLGHRSPDPSASKNAGIKYVQAFMVYIAQLDLTMSSTALRSADPRDGQASMSQACTEFRFGEVLIEISLLHQSLELKTFLVSKL
jgi:hypothetical protein